MSQDWKTVTHLLTPEQMGGKCRLFARVSILPGHGLLPHKHAGETETYYILSGRGLYDDDGEKRPAGPGDVFFCADGHSHGIVCIGDEPMEFIALIISGRAVSDGNAVEGQANGTYQRDCETMKLAEEKR